MTRRFFVPSLVFAVVLVLVLFTSVYRHDPPHHDDLPARRTLKTPIRAEAHSIKSQPLAAQPIEAQPKAQLPLHSTPPLAAAISLHPTDNLLTGTTIMPKLGNATAKAELGRAAWRLFHTIMARFPDKPTPDEREALHSYIHLFVRLYPCGECAEHFREIVRRFPPQVSSRSAAATWACHVHNQVNLRLGKEVFDCSNIGEFYDCGCAEGEEENEEEKGKGKVA
ncbi:hypothetical protein K470DRAFT_254865 [Piedraia hortae CBS 480.64]|uniref:Sulfhydryl oxidase n=1 Tax=Piedraia hortae CBS 480.64 TaxID=1314780 RepID=A0A6A7C823_9PEZI|nr:hypothetical protein K470DRAFT_254865 [Piedraia hortae CBS 480.64]